MMPFRMLTGLLAALVRRRPAPAPAPDDRLMAENLELRRKVEDLREGNLRLVRERRMLRFAADTQPREARAREVVDRIRGILRSQGVNVGRTQAPVAVEQLIAEVSLLREKVGTDTLRREGLEDCGTGLGPDCEAYR